eukprot:7388825-Prymnesium_polylepis.3
MPAHHPLKVSANVVRHPVTHEMKDIEVAAEARSCVVPIVSPAFSVDRLIEAQERRSRHRWIASLRQEIALRTKPALVAFIPATRTPITHHCDDDTVREQQRYYHTDTPVCQAVSAGLCLSKERVR